VYNEAHLESSQQDGDHTAGFTPLSHYHPNHFLQVRLTLRASLPCPGIGRTSGRGCSATLPSLPAPLADTGPKTALHSSRVWEFSALPNVEKKRPRWTPFVLCCGFPCHPPAGKEVSLAATSSHSSHLSQYQPSPLAHISQAPASLEHCN